MDELVRIVGVLTALLPLIVWVVWWLWAVNWKRLRPVLAQGGWAPAVLLFLMSAVAWSRLEPGPCACLPGFALPNFVWQLGAVTGLAVVALFCGWLQGRLGWAPAEISIEPPAASDDGHGPHH